MKTFRLRSSDWIETKGEINLSFSFQTLIYYKCHLICRDDSNGMIYILLKAAGECCAVVEDKEVLKLL